MKMTEIVGRLNISLFCQWRYLKIRRQKKIIKIWGVIFFFFFFLFLKINHATYQKQYGSVYPHRSRDSLSPVCGICFFLSHFMDQFSHFHKSETTIAKQFFLNLNFCFLILVQYYLETCVNCVAKCVTQKFTTLKSEFKRRKKIIMSLCAQFRQFVHISEPTLSKTVVPKL